MTADRTEPLTLDQPSGPSAPGGVTLTSAHVLGDADTAAHDRAACNATVGVTEPTAVEIDRSGDQAILNARSGQPASPRDYAAIGDVAEAAVARHIAENLNHEIIHLNTKPGEQGIDLVTFDAASGKLFIWEAKSSLIDGAISTAPRMGPTNSGKQMGYEWIIPRLREAGLNDLADDWEKNGEPTAIVETRAVKIDLKTGQAQIWVIDPATGAKQKYEDHPVDIDDLLELQG